MTTLENSYDPFVFSCIYYILLFSALSITIVEQCLRAQQKESKPYDSLSYGPPPPSAQRSRASRTRSSAGDAWGEENQLPRQRSTGETRTKIKEIRMRIKAIRKKIKENFRKKTK